MKKLLISATCFVLLLSGCVTQPTSNKSALELQAIQVREFETSEKLAFTSVLSVFQDLGFIISTASIETGLITAKSPSQRSFEAFRGAVSSDEKANAFVESAGKGRVKIRLSFVKSTRHFTLGEQDSPITDPLPYQNAFSKIQQSIFVRSNTN